MGLLRDFSPLSLDLRTQSVPVKSRADGATRARLGDLRLVQAVERPGAERRRGELGGGVGADHDDGERQRARAVPRGAQQVQAGHVRELEIEDRAVRGILAEDLACRRARIDDRRLVPKLLVAVQIEDVQVRPGRVVFDDQDAYDVAGHATVPLPNPVRERSRYDRSPGRRLHRSRCVPAGLASLVQNH